MVKRCPATRCPHLIPSGARYCPEHQAEYETKRGNSSQRGYGSKHQGLRARWAPKVATGKVRCARCNQPIKPGQAWDLGHDDTDRNKYSGPEHLNCNRSAGGKRGRQSQD